MPPTRSYPFLSQSTRLLSVHRTREEPVMMLHALYSTPCAQDLRRVTLHTFAFCRVPSMLLSPLSFLTRSAGCPKRCGCSLPPASFRCDLPSAEAAHFHKTLIIFEIGASARERDVCLLAIGD